MIDNRIYHPQQSTVPMNRNIDKLSYPSTCQGNNGKTSFAQILDQKNTGVQFSQHALDRLQARNIKLGQTELLQLDAAIDKAALKGAKESLVFMNNNNLAFVVSVKNKTVITAMHGANIKDNIFTNIDSAVII